ncbi:MAG TPA: rhomboid family intramembrane serine protease [Anaerolineales bacterium]|nr:rhomboid family intramembrane serine protease [Anaerolineales bacterium]
MSIKQRIPYATIIIALLITIIQVFRMIGGSYEEFVFANLHHWAWEFFYDQPWRMLTSPFIHQNLPHYFENLFFLTLFGFQIERVYGWKYMLGAFLGAQVTGYGLHIIFMHEGIIGISGGVCGLFGFSLVANRRTPWWKTLTHRPLHILYSLNLLGAVVADIADWVPFGVAHDNHIVGILYGVAFGLAFLIFHRPTWRQWAVAALPVLFFASQYYSPWQLEWRLVHSKPVLNSPVADCRTRTVDESTPAIISFVNSLGKPVAIYWMDLDGHSNFAHVLNPSETIGYGTVITRAWCIVDLDSKEALQAIVVTEPEQTITIR